jgi:hypothetical protein
MRAIGGILSVLLLSTHTATLHGQADPIPEPAASRVSPVLTTGVGVGVGILLGAGIGAALGARDSTYSYTDSDCIDFDYEYGCEGYARTTRTRKVRTANPTSTVVGAVVGGLAGGLVGFLIGHEINKERAAEVRVGPLTIDLRHIHRGTVAARLALPH